MGEKAEAIKAQEEAEEKLFGTFLEDHAEEFPEALEKFKQKRSGKD